MFKSFYYDEEVSEKLRLFYVALTRAKEKMIIVMPKCEEDNETLDLVPDYERDKYNSFLAIMKSIYSIVGFLHEIFISIFCYC